MSIKLFQSELGEVHTYQTYIKNYIYNQFHNSRISLPKYFLNIFLVVWLRGYAVLTLTQPVSAWTFLHDHKFCDIYEIKIKQNEDVKVF